MLREQEIAGGRLAWQAEPSSLDESMKPAQAPGTDIELYSLEGHEVVDVHAPLLEALPWSKMEVASHLVHLGPPTPESQVQE